MVMAFLGICDILTRLGGGEGGRRLCLRGFNGGTYAYSHANSHRSWGGHCLSVSFAAESSGMLLGHSRLWGHD